MKFFSEQPAKALDPTSTEGLLIVKSVSDEQLSKQFDPIDLTLVPNVTEIKFLQE